MKHLIMLGTVGNNTAVLQIPTTWSIDEVKCVLTRALALHHKHILDMASSTSTEYLAHYDENELNLSSSKTDSEVIKVCTELMQAIGNPKQANSGLTWQLNAMRYIAKHPEFDERACKAFSKPLTAEERMFIATNYLESFEQLLNN